MRVATRSSERSAILSNGDPKADRELLQSASPQRPLIVIAGGATAIGVAWAAAFTARSDVDPRVGITARVAAAIVGTAATIAAAKNS